LIVAALTVGTASAATVEFVNGGDVWVNLYVTGTTDDDGYGWDELMAVCYNGNGEIMDTDEVWAPVGVTWMWGIYCDEIFAATVFPIEIEVRDVTSYLPDNDLSQMPAILAAPAILTYNSDGFQAPSIPAGYIQHNIVCDTPVYDGPGGTPVGDNMVTAGQAWHVNPTPEAGLDGQNWTAIFVSGRHIGYIPTSCVGAPTVFGEMAQYE
jgi:hypothetical protein